MTTLPIACKVALAVVMFMQVILAARSMTLTEPSAAGVNAPSGRELGSVQVERLAVATDGAPGSRRPTGAVASRGSRCQGWR